MNADSTIRRIVTACFAALFVASAVLGYHTVQANNTIADISEENAELEKKNAYLSSVVEEKTRDIEQYEAESETLHQRVTAQEEEIEKIRKELATAQATRTSSTRVSRAQGSYSLVEYDNGNKVTLTFDDSASPSRVSRLLDILKEKNVPAIMFPNGNWARANPELIERMRAEGHVLANHTASHANLRKLSDSRIREEIEGGIYGPILRPPYGAYNARVYNIAHEMGYKFMLWDVDTRDWAGTSATAMTNKVLAEAKPGSVVLFHFHGDHTPEALPGIIDGLRERGLELGY